MPKTQSRQKSKTPFPKPPLHPNTERRRLDLHALFNAAVGENEAEDSEEDEPEDEDRVLTAIEEDWIDEDLVRADRGDENTAESEGRADSDDEDAETLLSIAERMREAARKGKAVATTSDSPGQVYPSFNEPLDGDFTTASSDDEDVVVKSKNAKYISLLYDKDMSVCDPQSAAYWALVPSEPEPRHVPFYNRVTTNVQIETREEESEGSPQEEVETIDVPFTSPSKKKQTTVTRPSPKTKRVRDLAPKKPKLAPKKKKRVMRDSTPRRVTRQTARTEPSEPPASPEHSAPYQPDPTEARSDSSFTLVEGFSSQRAKDLFEKLRNKPALPERGFDERTLADLDFIRSAVEFQNWKKLSKVRKAYNLTLVRCFYADAATSKRRTLRVRGTRVEFTAEAFNSLLGLTPPEATDFDDLMTSATKESLDALIRDLAQPNTDWTPHDNYLLRTFRTCNLVPNANVWMNFITHTVSPTTHTSSVSVERMVLLHCILENKSINMGEVILKRMRYCAGRAQGKLFYPFLVQKLCKNAGVPVYDDDEIIRQGDEKCIIGLREVSRCKTTKGSVDLVSVVQNLVDQNRELTTSLISLKSASKARVQIKIEKARAVWEIEAKRKRKEKVREAKKEAKRLKKDNKKLESRLAEKERIWNEERTAIQSRLGLLQRKIEEMEAAATNAATLVQHSDSGQPTPSV